MRRFALSSLAVLGVLAALAVTASSTAQQARASGMTGAAVLGLVVLLEVINVAGTWTWLTDTRAHVRWEAFGGVGVASIVTGACGALTYGLIGLVAPAGLLFAVHLTFRLNQPAVPSQVSGQDGERDGVPSREDAVPSAGRMEPPPVPARVPDDQDSVPTIPAPVPSRRDDQDTGPIPITSAVPLARDEVYIAELVERDTVPGIGAIATEFGIGKTKAARCKAEAQRRRGEAA